MRLLVATLLTAFLFFTPPCGAKTPDNPLKNLIWQTELSVVKVETALGVNEETGRPMSYVCTGFIVDSPKNWVITARHCIPDDKNVEKVTVNGEPTNLVGSDDNFALLYYDTKMQKPPLELRKGLPEVGEAVIAFGWGYGEMLVLQRHVAEIHTDDDNKDHKDVVTDVGIAKGMSGGPIVDLNGQVVGINQASNELIGISCSSLDIRRFLKSIK